MGGTLRRLRWVLLRWPPQSAALALSAAYGGTSPARVGGYKEWI